MGSRPALRIKCSSSLRRSPWAVVAPASALAGVPLIAVPLPIRHKPWYAFRFSGPLQLADPPTPCGAPNRRWGERDAVGKCLSRRSKPVSYTHLRAHETDSYLVCRLLLE